MVDMAHIAGLVAGSVHPSPVPYADVITTTTHKSLRGPRGGIILTNDEEIAKKIDKTVFPGIQGGPLMHVIAAKAQCFKEALQENFKIYTSNIIKNAADALEGCSDNTREIKVEVRQGESFVLMKVKNTIMGKNIILANGIPITNKSDSELHGFGIKNIISAVEKYDGRYSYRIENSYYIAEVYLKI